MTRQIFGPKLRFLLANPQKITERFEVCAYIRYCKGYFEL
jgi:hypothetical protein